MSVRFSGVTYSYPGADRSALLDVDVDWSGPGFQIVTGNLGAGCSTWLMVAAGLAPRITSGTRTGDVSVLGVDPASPAGAREVAGRVALLLSTPWTQLSGMTYRVWDEIAFGPANLGWSPQRIRDAVDRVVEVFRLSSLTERDPVTLSGGELQRVVLAGLLAMEPEVLLLDEPGVELDPVTAIRVFDMLRDLAAEVCVVLATNDLDRAGALADDIVVLEHGAVRAQGPPETVLRLPAAVDLGVTTTVGYVMRASGADVLPLDVESAVRYLRSR